MNARTSYVLVGLFVLGLGTAFVGAILWLGSGNAGQDYKTYRVYFTESVSGLSRDGAVKYRGVNVGRIHDISLDPGNPERVQLTLEIRKGTPIKQDTVATLEVRGLTGLAYVNLVGGSQKASSLAVRKGEEYPEIPSRPSIWGRLDKNLGVVLENLVDASRQLKRWLSDDNRELLLRTFQHVEKLSNTLARRSDSIDNALTDLAATLHNTRQASGNLPALVENLQKGAHAFEQMSGEFEHSASDFRHTSTALREAISARDRDLQRFTSNALPESAAMVSDLRQAAANLRQLSESLKRDPGLLLRGPAPRAPGPGEQESMHP